MDACHNNKEVYMSNILYKDTCALVIIQIGEFVGRLSDDFREIKFIYKLLHTIS